MERSGGGTFGYDGGVLTVVEIMRERVCQGCMGQNVKTVI